MAADTIILTDDLLHATKTAVVFTSSTTDTGYHRENVRDTNLSTAWKGVDSTTADIWLQADVGATGYFGGVGAIVYCAIAYDARNNEQDTLNLNTDDADNPAMTAQTTELSFTLVKNGSGPVVQYGGFSQRDRRYWRLLGPGGARSEAAGSKVPKIYAWAMFRTNSVISLASSTYKANASGPGGLGLRSKVARMETGGGVIFTNRYGSTDQEIELNFPRANAALWTVLRDQLYALDNDNRAWWLQYEGLRSDGTANFAMVRTKTGFWSADRRVMGDLYDTPIPVVTEPWH